MKTKQILISILCILMFGTVKSQIPINLRFPGRSEDILSQGNYNAINRYNQLMIPSVTTNSATVTAFTSVIDNQFNELITISPQLKFQEITIKRFINDGSFSTTRGYNSYGYIKKKYPVLNLTNPSDIVRNKIIRLRFFKKLRSEKEKVDDYLDFTNPITEGERILLVLTALEKVINITLENETY